MIVMVMMANDCICEQDIAQVKELLVRANGDCEIKPISPAARLPAPAGVAEGNEQTDKLLEILQLPHIWTVAASSSSPVASSLSPPTTATAHAVDVNEVDIDEFFQQPEEAAAAGDDGDVAAVDNNEIDINDF